MAIRPRTGFDLSQKFILIKQIAKIKVKDGLRPGQNKQTPHPIKGIRGDGPLVLPSSLIAQYLCSFLGRKKALYNYKGLACLCRKFVIFWGRESCKSLCVIELKNYGIFEDSRIVQSQYVRKVRSS